MTRRLRLHYRIVIPFVLVAILVPAITAFGTLFFVIRSLEARVEKQTLKTALIVSPSDFALNKSILSRVKDITGSDVITYRADGTVLFSTSDEQGTALAKTVTGSNATRELLSSPEGAAVIRHTQCADDPCYVAFRRVVGRNDLFVAVVVDTSDLNAATSAITRTILLSTALSVLVMAFVSQIVARRVTGPLEELVTFTHQVSPGVSRQRAVERDDEIGGLAAAFNQMLDRLDRAQDALVRSEKLALTGLLAARVAHDIRNPLSSIKMQAQLLLQSRMSGEQARPLLQAVLHDIDQVESVVHGLLELARPGELTRTSNNLNDVVAGVLRHMAAQMAHRRITVAVNFADSMPAIPLDADRFRQAVRNILVNAADAMPQGGTITVDTRAADAESTVTLQICDDGLGIPVEILDRVFDPFVSSKREGVGLGLVNAKAVIDGHGGSITLASRQPKGTCVTIRLPQDAAIPAAPAKVIRG